MKCPEYTLDWSQPWSFSSLLKWYIVALSKSITYAKYAKRKTFRWKTFCSKCMACSDFYLLCVCVYVCCRRRRHHVSFTWTGTVNSMGPRISGWYCFNFSHLLLWMDNVNTYYMRMRSRSMPWLLVLRFFFVCTGVYCFCFISVFVRRRPRR